MSKELEKQNEEEVWSFMSPQIKETLDMECTCILKNKKVELCKKYSSLSRTLLLIGQQGSNLYTSRMLKAIADKYNVPLFLVDFNSIGDAINHRRALKLSVGDKVKFIGQGKKNENIIGKEKRQSATSVLLDNQPLSFDREQTISSSFRTCTTSATNHL